MQNISNFFKQKVKYILILTAILGVLLSIYVFNGVILDNSSILQAADGTYVEASGSVENNSIIISSEVTGNMIEIGVKEGEAVKADQAIAEIENTGLANRYEGAKTNLEIANQNVAALEDNIRSYKVQNEKLITQANSAYLAAEAEYQKVRDGASEEEIRQAKEAVNQTEITRTYLKGNLDRSSVLLEAQIIPQAAYDEVEKNYQIAEAQYNAAESKLNLLKSMPTASDLKVAQNKMLQAKSGYELAISSGGMQLIHLENQLVSAKIQMDQAQKEVVQSKTEFEKTVVQSPIDGVVNSIFFDKGELVVTGKPIIEIYNPDKIEIKVYVSEANIGHIKVGQDVRLFVDSHRDRAFSGKVIRINNEAEFTPKNIQTKEERVNTVFKVKIEAENSEGVIKPGMPVEANIKIN